MSKQIDQIVAQMEANPTQVRFADLVRVCEYFFGSPRQAHGSHVVFRMPWPGDPRVNIQNLRGKAKPYQVRQVLTAIRRMEVHQDGID
jgi:hypothetical protein